MTEKVVPFPPFKEVEETNVEQLHEELVFVCTCGTRTFEVMGHTNSECEGYLKCSGCGNEVEVEGSDWRKKLPPVPDDTEGLQDTIGTTIHSRSNSPTNLVVLRVLRNIGKWDPDDIALMVGFHEDGAGEQFFTFNTEEQRQWVLDRLDQVKDYVTKRVL